MNKVSKREIFPFFIPSKEEYGRAKIFLAMGKDRHRMARAIATFEFYQSLADELVCPDRINDKRNIIKQLHLGNDFTRLKKTQKELHLEIMQYYAFEKKIEKIAQDML